MGRGAWRLLSRSETTITGRICERHAWRISVVISSVIFGLIHYEWGLAGVVQTTFMGFALALAYLKFGRRLWVVILTHAYMEILLRMQMYFA